MEFLVEYQESQLLLHVPKLHCMLLVSSHDWLPLPQSSSEIPDCHVDFELLVCANHVHSTLPQLEVQHLSLCFLWVVDTGDALLVGSEGDLEGGECGVEVAEDRVDSRTGVTFAPFCDFKFELRMGIRESGKRTVDVDVWCDGDSMRPFGYGGKLSEKSESVPCSRRGVEDRSERLSTLFEEQSVCYAIPKVKTLWGKMLRKISRTLTTLNRISRGIVRKVGDSC